MRKINVMVPLLTLSALTMAHNAHGATGCNTTPACDASDQNTCLLAVETFGISSTSSDNSQCFKEIVELAITESSARPVEISFGAETYPFVDPVEAKVTSLHSGNSFTNSFPVNNSRIAIANKTSTNVITIRGELDSSGKSLTTLQFVGFNQTINDSTVGLNALGIYSSQYISVHDLRMTYDKYPFTQGVLDKTSITADGDSVTIDLDNGYGAPQQFIHQDKDKSYLVTYKDYSTDANSPDYQTYEKVPSDLKFTSSEELTSGRYKLQGFSAEDMKYLNDHHKTKAGLKVALSPKIGGETLYFFNSNNIDIKNVEVSNCPAVAVRGQNGGHDISLDNVRYVPRRLNTDHEKPLMAGTAGGFIFQAIRGGLTIKNSTVDHNADDTIGLFARGTDILNVNGDKTKIQVSEKKAQFLREGDSVDTYKASDSSPLDIDLTIEDITPLSETPYNSVVEITLDKSLENTEIGDFIGSRNATIGVDGNRFLVENNTLKHNKGRAIRTNASYGDIKNNIIIRNGNGGIWLGGDATHNSQCSEHVVISGNTAKYQLSGPAFIVYNAIKKLDGKGTTCNRNLTFKGNVVRNQAKSVPAFFIDNTQDSEISGNKFKSEYSTSSIIKDVLEDRLNDFKIRGDERNNTVIISNHTLDLDVKNNKTNDDTGKKYIYKCTKHTKYTEDTNVIEPCKPD
ncbi:right-handed parallel beta-helix repeat-containing protein [Shewanella submarina]|uniref:Right-handed parallel beta-helix repeat-containing protein n=1 Tax=Shewanella submarina TaxID=2016376 RepID=A0ABV7GDP9_9GAMM|nr:right-handed parallel beta-helix repeat-containing protein [Shewanella submarina]MCL1037767.1 right-handed parallel beta-helix repeat-containing protein [Shewanella submarina]